MSSPEQLGFENATDPQEEPDGSEADIVVPPSRGATVESALKVFNAYGIGALRRKAPFVIEDDPNADLIGYEFDSDRGRLVVTNSSPWNPAYVACRSVFNHEHFQTVRVAAQVRRARQLDPED